ncbi:MAG: hypothetical protein HGB05_01555 [Chloroflexi bacterium]|nr:hypothetical protein [Chloroflexota bacterium]
MSDIREAISAIESLVKVKYGPKSFYVGQVIIANDPSFVNPDKGAFESIEAADLVIVMGAADLKDIGELAEKEHELFSQDRLVNLSNQVGSFGSINLTDPSSSNSELVTALLKELSLPLDVDIANNLMQGIENVTAGLSSPNMTADTFEALAILYRTGARRTAPIRFLLPSSSS